MDREGILEPRTAVRDSVAHFAAVRDAVGPEVEIVIDYHTRLDPPDAIKLGRELEAYDPFFLEDPLRCENPQTYRQIRQHVSTPLAVGEHYATKWEFRQMIEEECSTTRVSICASSAVSPKHKIANWCETHYKDRATQPAGARVSRCLLHPDSACDNFAVQEAGPAGDPVMEDLFPCSSIKEATYRRSLPQGLSLMKMCPSQLRFQWQNSPQLRRKDGSFTNW